MTSSFFPTGVRLDGARKLRSTLRKAGADMTQLRDANKQAADIVTDRARGTAPRVSGRLLGSIRTGASQSSGVVRAGNNRKTAAGIPYAGVIHWGWPARGIQAQPWISEAAQDTEQTWFEVYAEHVNNLLKSVEGA